MLVIIALLIIIGIMIILLRAAGKSQTAIQMTHLRAEMEAAKDRGNMNAAKKAAQELIELLDEENLHGGVYDRARNRAQEIVNDP